MTIVIDMTIDQHSTTPHITESNEGELAVSIGDDDAEIRLVGTPADLLVLVDNIRAGLRAHV